MSDGWDRVGHSVERAVVVTIGAAVLVGGAIGAAIGYLLTPYPTQHRHITARRRT